MIVHLLQDILVAEWRKHTVLPSDLRASPPPSSAQKVHAKLSVPAPAEPEPTPAAQTSALRVSTPKPAGQSTFRASAPTPAVASTSKAVPIRPRTPQHPVLQLRPPSLDMDVDVEVEVDVLHANDSTVGTRTSAGGSEVMAGAEAEGAGVGMGMERDSESDEIVRVLEKGLPRWKGYEDVGWMADVGHVSIILSLHSHRSFGLVVGATC